MRRSARENEEKGSQRLTHLDLWADTAVHQLLWKRQRAASPGTRFQEREISPLFLSCRISVWWLQGPKGVQQKRGCEPGLGQGRCPCGKRGTGPAPRGSSGLASFFQTQPRGTGSKNRPSGLHARPATPPMTSFFPSGSSLARALQRQGRRGAPGTARKPRGC